MRRSGWVCSLVMGLGLCAGTALARAAAKDGTQHLAFEVISIRRNTAPPAGPPQFGATPDGFHALGLPLIALFQMAYAPSDGSGFLRGDRIVGAPDWLTGTAERYDVLAKVGEADLADWQKPELQQAMLHAMLKELLAQRCKAAVHSESKEMPVYDLVLAKGGPKFKPAEIVDPVELKAKHAGGMAVPGGGMIVPNSTGVQLYGISMAMFGQALLSSFAGRPVVDKTGLSGRYDIVLQPPAPPPPPPPGSASPSQAAPPAMIPEETIFTELPEKLGLKLEPAKTQIETLVIDHVERPSEN